MRKRPNCLGKTRALCTASFLNRWATISTPVAQNAVWLMKKSPLLPYPTRKEIGFPARVSARTSDIPPPQIPFGHAPKTCSSLLKNRTIFSDARISATAFPSTKIREEHAEPSTPLSRFTVTSTVFDFRSMNEWSRIRVSGTSVAASFDMGLVAHAAKIIVTNIERILAPSIMFNPLSPNGWVELLRHQT